MLLIFFFSYVIPLLIILTGVFLYIWYRKRQYLTGFLIFLFFVLIYSASNLSNLHTHSAYNHYTYLADALLHGRTYLDNNPLNLDVAVYNDKIYVCHNPLPALMMLPFVLIYGTDFNDILFTIILGAINASLVYSMILRLNAHIKDFRFLPHFALFMTLLFGLGTVHWYVTARGTSWHTANIVTLFYLLLAINEALGKRRYGVVGIFAALAVVTRPSVFWAFPFFVALGVADFLVKKKFKEFFCQMSLYILPYIILGALLGLWNFIRFGNPFDFGFAYLNHAPNLKEDFDRYGAVNFHFLSRNLKIAFFDFYRRIRMFPYFVPRPDGMAIQYTSPFFLYLFAPLIYLLVDKIKKIKTVFPFNAEIVIGSVLATICTAIPLLLYFNTGWVQFGYRYLLDYIPFLLILTAFCMRGKITRFGIVLFTVALLVNLGGVIVYIHNELNIGFAPLF